MSFVPGNEKIPVQFEYHGKIYKGFLSQPNGAGTSTWSLTVPEFRNGKWGEYHWGTLVQYMNDDWRMTSYKGDLLHLSDYFRDVVINWYQ